MRSGKSVRRKLAVVNCKALKGDKNVPAEQLYQRSKMFRVQLDLINACYDGYIILSAGHGVVKPNQKIKPYNIAMSKGSRVKFQSVLSKEQKIEWANKVITDSIWNEYDEIHFHISNPYWKPIQRIIDLFPNKKITKVGLQVNMGLNIKCYQKALVHFNKTGKLDLSIISTRKPSKDPEQARWFFHPIHGKFFGFARQLVKKYPEVDEGNLYRVGRGKAKQTMGWVIDKNKVKHVKYVNGKWRIQEKINN